MQTHSNKDQIPQELLAKIQSFEYIIWDWNGTLLDDFSLIFSVLKAQLEQHSLPVPTPEDCRNKFCFPVSAYYERLGFDFSKISFSTLSDDFLIKYEKRIAETGLFAGTKALLKTIHDLGSKQAILSLAEQAHLDYILPQFQIQEYFQHIFGSPEKYTKSKLARGKELLATSGFPPEKTIFVGDTDHDGEVGDALGLTVLLVAEGCQSYEYLKQQTQHQVLKSRHSH